MDCPECMHTVNEIMLSPLFVLFSAHSSYRSFVVYFAVKAHTVHSLCLVVGQTVTCIRHSTNQIPGVSPTTNQNSKLFIGKPGMRRVLV